MPELYHFKLSYSSLKCLAHPALTYTKSQRTLQCVTTQPVYSMYYNLSLIVNIKKAKKVLQNEN